MDFDFNLSRSKVLEKVDGSLMKLYYHKGEWYVSTRGTCFADVPVGAFDMTFAQLFWRAALGTADVESQALLKPQFLARHHTDVTYVYELACPENRVVTRYQSDQLVLLACRGIHGFYKSIDYMTNIITSLNSAGFSNPRLPEMVDASSFDELVEKAESLGGLKEGFVAWDLVSDERIKFKSTAYVAVHHIRGNGALVPKRICELVLMNEHEEYLTYFPEDRAAIEPYADALEILSNAVEIVYAETHAIESQKDFALAVKDYPFSAILFHARKAKIEPQRIREAIKAQKKSYLVDLMIKYKE